MCGKIDGNRMNMESTKGINIDRLYKKLVSVHPSFLLELPQGGSLEKRYDLVTMKKEWVKPVLPFEVELISPGRTYIEEIKREVVIEETVKDGKMQGFSQLSDTALLDYQSLRFPLKIRNFRPGDRFQPLGVKGTQKLKEFFIDHKIPNFERQRVPLLVSGGIIAWVMGYRIDERFKVKEMTQRVLRVELMPERRNG
jgi:tRNA(Ile)-lysidine synthase